ncbi:hypothetical protein Bca4012_044196 [Brassica carinata]
MRMRIALKKKSDPGQFAIPCTMKGIAFPHALCDTAYTRQHMHTEEYDEDYEDERATEYKAILDEEDTLLHHSSWKRNAPSIDIPGSPSIDTQPPQRNRK